MDFIRTIESATGRKAIIDYQPMQAGDVKKTWAQVDGLKEDFDYKPHVSVETGISSFIDWYNQFYLNQTTITI
jgi:UDP-glucuronate 4-epimerase